MYIDGGNTLGRGEYMKTKGILEQIARENHITVAEAERQMAEAIRQAMASSDPMVRQRWKKIAPDGKTPSVEEFLKYCAKSLK